jgi:serine/threonine protein kinase
VGRSKVAIKRLDRNYGQGDLEFLKEILMLSGYKHENLISLLGFCDEDGEKILVYEYASHGSLDRHLSSTSLTWRERLKICLGAAVGLSYLHDPRDTQQRVIHRDIKSSNILLDQYWNAKVSDMGLSKIGPANQKHTFLATNVVGTFGYLDPMYVEMSILTKESDVYSFGVVLFEVLCGRLCFQYLNGHYNSLVRIWKQSYKQKRLDNIIFRDLKEHIDRMSLEAFSDIAYRCLHKSREERPQMSEVVEQLEIALRFQSRVVEKFEIALRVQEISEGVEYEVYGSTEELNMLLPNGIPEMNNSGNNRWNTWKAVIRSNFNIFLNIYFSTPWAIISTMAALLMLLLTIVQVSFIIISYENTFLSHVNTNTRI